MEILRGAQYFLPPLLKQILVQKFAHVAIFDTSRKIAKIHVYYFGHHDVSMIAHVA